MQTKRQRRGENAHRVLPGDSSNQFTSLELALQRGIINGELSISPCARELKRKKEREKGLVFAKKAAVEPKECEVYC